MEEEEEESSEKNISPLYFLLAYVAAIAVATSSTYLAQFHEFKFVFLKKKTIQKNRVYSGRLRLHCHKASHILHDHEAVNGQRKNTVLFGGR